jgi:hypothetical protein
MRDLLLGLQLRTLITMSGDQWPGDMRLLDLKSWAMTCSPRGKHGADTRPRFLLGLAQITALPSGSHQAALNFIRILLNRRAPAPNGQHEDQSAANKGCPSENQRQPDCVGIHFPGPGPVFALRNAP